jgi:ParB family chromosome partitioning protein
MGDVDELQIAEEKAAQRAEEAAEKQVQKRQDALRREPLRATALTTRREPQAIALTQIHPGENIRLDLPEISELARSIREVGLLTPLLVRPWNEDASADGPLPADADGDQYRLIAGHRRHAALTALTEAGVNGFDEAPCEIRAGLTEAEMYALMLTENVQRVALEPIQAARALRLLLDLNEGMDAATLARSLGLKPAWTQTHLKLLDLPQEVQDRIEAGDLSVTIADLLRRGQSKGRIDEEKVKEIAQKVASGEITSAQAKAAVAPPKNTQAPKTVSAHEQDMKSDDPREQWKSLGPVGVDADGAPLVRPATPLTGDGPALPRVPSDRPAAATGAAALESSGPAAVELPLEQRLDAYLLGRALREWADDDYLDRLGIDRVQVESWAHALDFEERIGAIRRLSYTLMQQDGALV